MRTFTAIIIGLIVIFLFLELSGIKLTAPGERQTVETEKVVVETYDQSGNIVNSSVVQQGNNTPNTGFTSPP